MSLYAIADLHLSLGTNKPMDAFPGWRDYVARLEKNWRSLISEEDTVVVAGDISWGMTLEQSRADFAFLESLPGRKLLFKGNHDYWWTTRKKMDFFFEQAGFQSITIVHNTAEPVGDLAVCGTRGWFYDAEADEDKKVLAREAGRLNASIDAAEKTGREPVVFLHYPPIWGDRVCEEMLAVLEQRGVRRCYYGHIHGTGIRWAVQGTVRGIQLRLISGDSLSFMPLLVR
ncbi:MAG: serine/threonine protein phosphatase [Clostridiales bacterium]|nr:serine/threonine protein phosphatase [Clostridiales bacterium]